MPVVFYSVLTVVLVAGIAGTAFSRHQREQRLNPSGANKTPPIANVDHWHVAYGVYVCGKFLPPVADKSNTNGIFTLADGVIHVQPKNKSAAGNNAKLGKFASQVKLKVSTPSFTVPAGLDGPAAKTYRDGEKCPDGTPDGGKTAVVKAFYDAPPAADRSVDLAKDYPSGKQVAGNPANIKLTDGGALVLAFVPDATKTVPYPPSLTNLDHLADVAPTTPEGAPTTTTPGATTVPGATTAPTTTVPGATTVPPSTAPGATTAAPTTTPTTAPPTSK